MRRIGVAVGSCRSLEAVVGSTVVESIAAEDDVSDEDT